MKVSIRTLAAVCCFPLLVRGYEGPEGEVAPGGVHAGDDLDFRIVGGEAAFAGEFPWFASSINGSLCGASFVGGNVLLTAAHCSRAFQVGSDVYVRAYRFQSSSRGAIRRTITKTVRHPKYGSAGNDFDYDFMLVQIDDPVEGITPVQLNKDGAVPEDDASVTVMGFGTTSEGGSISRDLLKVEVKKDPRSVCSASYFSSYDDAIMLCASDPGQDRYVSTMMRIESRSWLFRIGFWIHSHACVLPHTRFDVSCQGDSGGPLVLTGTNIQVGIVSFGRGCARREPG